MKHASDLQRTARVTDARRCGTSGGAQLKTGVKPDGGVKGTRRGPSAKKGCPRVEPSEPAMSLEAVVCLLEVRLEAAAAIRRDRAAVRRDNRLRLLPLAPLRGNARVAAVGAVVGALALEGRCRLLRGCGGDGGEQ